MFSYLKLNNFKSFSSLNANFLGKAKRAKKIICIYGENGSGKSNLIYSFMFLKNTLETLRTQNLFQELLSKDKEEIRSKEEHLKLMFSKKYNQLEQLVKEARYIGAQDKMKIEYGFIIDGKRGYYSLTFNNKNKVDSEKLFFVLDNRSGFLFELSESKIHLSPSIFVDSEYKDEILTLIEKFWGKHTLLAILLNEIEEKNYNYISKRISKSLLKVINFLRKFSVQCKVGSRGEMGYTSGIHKVFFDLNEGTINKDEQNILNNIENLLRTFFTSIYADVKDVYYEKKFVNTQINYKLFLKKIIGDKLINLDFNLESTGTHKLLEILPLILQSTSGGVVLIDEIDCGIHDLLITDILTGLEESISGQFICTTHNTHLMEQINKDSIHFLNVDIKGLKALKSVTDYDERTQDNHNVRIRYIKGMYKAIPNINYIDYDELSENYNQIKR
mgnify:CR=1 FL=1|jgi:hypothetical protein